MRIAVIGVGNIGGTLGEKWTAAGHEVIFGVRDPSASKVQALLDRLQGGAQALSVPGALAEGEVILFAVPWSAVAGILDEHAKSLAGRVVIDATNNFGGPVISNLPLIRQRAPEASLYRAFNALGWEVFANPELGEDRADLFFCGPDGPGRGMVEALISDVGLRPVWVGGEEALDIVDRLGSLWVSLAFRRGLGRRLALRLLQE